MNHGCRHATLPAAHATKYQTISIFFAATKIPTLDPIALLTTFIRVTSMEAPRTVAIRTLVKAAARFRAEVVVADFKLFSVTHNLVSCVWLADDRLNVITYSLERFTLFRAYDASFRAPVKYLEYVAGRRITHRDLAF